jgi:hypothetical protein
MVVIDRPSDRQRKSRKKKMVYIYINVWSFDKKRTRKKRRKGGEKAVPILPPSRE